MIQEATGRRDDRLESWELELLVVESILLGGLVFGGFSILFRDSLPRFTGQAVGFFLMTLVIFPAIRALTRRKGHELPVRRYLGFALAGTLVGTLIIVLIESVF